MQSKATTVEQYLAELPPDRRAAIEQVRTVILKNLDRGADGKSGYQEGMGYGMIGYHVPHHVYPPGYHCNPEMPLPFAGLASQKNHMSIYLMTVYGDGGHWREFTQAWARTGKKLDMGKCCIRFRKVEDLALDVIGEAICRTPVKRYIEFYEKAILANNQAAAARASAKKDAASASRPSPKKSSAGTTPTAKKSAKKWPKKSAKTPTRNVTKKATKKVGKKKAGSSSGRRAQKRATKR
ncbi:MAG: DUF1801 domain-containing protein [Phycisphaerales bacterium]